LTYESAQQFFADLAADANPSRASDLDASYRFEVDGAGTWRVDVRKGQVAVDESDAPADCVVKTDEETFLEVIRQEQNPMGAYMTGKIRVEGDMGLALRLRDLLG
jgi:putative sterol carrier protein